MNEQSLKSDNRVQKLMINLGELSGTIETTKASFGTLNVGFKDLKGGFDGFVKNMGITNKQFSGLKDKLNKTFDGFEVFNFKDLLKQLPDKNEDSTWQDKLLNFFRDKEGKFDLWETIKNSVKLWFSNQNLGTGGSVNAIVGFGKSDKNSKKIEDIYKAKPDPEPLNNSFTGLDQTDVFDFKAAHEALFQWIDTALAHAFKQATDKINKFSKTANQTTKPVFDQGNKIDETTKKSDQGKTLGENLKESGDILKNNLKSASENIASSGISVATAFAESIIAFNGMIEGLIAIPIRVLDSFTSLFDSINDFPSMLNDSVDGFVEAIEKLPESIPKFIDALAEAIPVIIDAIVKAIPKIIENLVKSIPGIINSVSSSIMTGISSLLGKGTGASLEIKKLTEENNTYLDSISKTNDSMVEFRNSLDKSSRTLGRKFSDYKDGQVLSNDLKSQIATIQSQFDNKDINERDYLKQVTPLNEQLATVTKDTAEFLKEALSLGDKADAGFRELKNKKEIYSKENGKGNQDLLEMVRSDIGKLNDKYDLTNEVDIALYKTELLPLRERELDLQKALYEERRKEIDQINEKRKQLLKEKNQRHVDNLKGDLSKANKFKDSIASYLENQSRDKMGIKEWEKKINTTKIEIGWLNPKSNNAQRKIDLNQLLFEDLKQLGVHIRNLFNEFMNLSQGIKDYSENRKKGKEGYSEVMKRFKKGDEALITLIRKDSFYKGSDEYKKEALGYAKSQFETLKKIVSIQEKALAGFKNLKVKLAGWLKGNIQKDWKLKDWKRNFSQLNDKQSSLLKNDANPDLILAVQEGMFESLQNIVKLQEEEISQTKEIIGVLTNALDKTSSAIETIKGSKLSNEDSFQLQQNKFDRLFEATLTGTDVERAKAIEKLADFAPVFLDKAQSKFKSSDEYRTIYDNVIEKLINSEDYLKKNLSSYEVKLNKLGEEDYKNLIDNLSLSIDTNIDKQERQIELSENQIEKLDGISELLGERLDQRLDTINKSISDITENFSDFISKLDTKLNDFLNDYRSTLGLEPLAAEKGGIFKGPASGFPMTLHNTEAVVPLPDGRSIPVIGTDMNGKQLIETNKLLKELIDKQNSQIIVEVDGGKLDTRIQLVSDQNRVEADNRGMKGRQMII